MSSSNSLFRRQIDPGTNDRDSDWLNLRDIFVSTGDEMNDLGIASQGGGADIMRRKPTSHVTETWPFLFREKHGELTFSYTGNNRSFKSASGYQIVPASRQGKQR